VQSEAERYLEHARLCDQYAENAKDLEAVRTFREAAKAWRELAVQQAEIDSHQRSSDNSKD
jgi:hypothetical protein